MKSLPEEMKNRVTAYHILSPRTDQTHFLTTEKVFSQSQKVKQDSTT